MRGYLLTAGANPKLKNATPKVTNVSRVSRDKRAENGILSTAPPQHVRLAALKLVLASCAKLGRF
jgi:hypothetical protein